ncbi:putative metallophosphoesterase [Sporotomaculum syntrophicum]|uniref:Metallophosphoesterase n=1 Tax=Sporotomaculum syntrophicum TaxID=182264 RepID=A0A9D3AXX1_9FIRM|nr:metallophosphoesterase [Sporotomaculum syntrophicum]KAF1084118.1 putative metallophosphoesterase [Sporotomaculum syntrophicum]
MSVQALFEWVIRLAAFGMIISGLLLAYIYFQVNCPKIKRVDIDSSKIPSETKISILQISDFHNWHPTNQHIKLLAQIKQLNPDLIVITGDFVDRKTTNFANVFSLARELVQINPHTYFVIGNHEIANRRTPQLLSGLTNRGVRVLKNEHVVWSTDRLAINIYGIDYPGKKHTNLDRATQDIDTEQFTVLLSHAPAVIKTPVVSKADLVLCGHTHGGQVRLPFIGAIVASGQGFLPAYDKGIYHIGHTTLYIDSGLGTSLLPIRFLNRCQISFITITGK